MGRTEILAVDTQWLKVLSTNVSVTQGEGRAFTAGLYQTLTEELIALLSKDNIEERKVSKFIL